MLKRKTIGDLKITIYHILLPVFNKSEFTKKLLNCFCFFRK